MSTAASKIPAWWHALHDALKPLSCADDGTLVVGGVHFEDRARTATLDDPFHDADPRVAALQKHLYQVHYAGLESVDSEFSTWQATDVAALRSGPWRVLEQLSHGALVVQRGTLVRRIEAGEYLYDGVPARPVRGSLVTRQRPRWSRVLDPSFQYVFGVAEADTQSEATSVRYYFAAQLEQLEVLVRLLTSRLDEALVPFQLKYPSEQADVLRADAVVLYVGARYAALVHGLLEQHARSLRHHVRAVSPLWTLELFPGVAFAQDPVGDDSFGGSRCRALARGLLNAAISRAKSVDTVVHVRDAFVDAGIDWDSPHLEHAPDDPFGLRALRFEAKDGEAPRHKTPAGTMIESIALEHASRIGHHLCANAVWHADRCTWITDDVEDADGLQTLFTRTMNGNLYDGTLGVASFLVPLATTTGETHFAQTAAAALRHALHHPIANAVSLYEGRLGIVAGGLVLSQALGDATLARDYRSEASGIIETLPDATGEADLMHGMAGAILCLLQIARLVPERADAATEVARRYGRALCALAQRSDAGWHWPASGAALGLCGLSHGNAGIAVAFAALNRVDSDGAWTDALQATIAYEQHWFLPGQGNWPYLFAEDATSLDDRPQSCGMAWCHGAPGVALSRLALWKITGDAEFLNTATIALQTVASDLSHAASVAGSNDSLCHGPLGNGDILLTGAHVLKESKWRDIAVRVAREAITRNAADAAWQSGLGIPNGSSDGLMLGIAGTGYFLLRLAHPSMPTTVLLPFSDIER